jgi:hypothetical protein
MRGEGEGSRDEFTGTYGALDTQISIFLNF